MHLAAAPPVAFRVHASDQTHAWPDGPAIASQRAMENFDEKWKQKVRNAWKRKWPMGCIT